MTTGYRVDYTNEHGEFSISANFALDAALRMANTLYTAVSKLDGLPAWGQIRSVTIVPTGEPLDTRTIEEIESQAIA